MAASATDLKAKYSQILRDNDIADEIDEVIVTIPNLVGEHMASVIETARINFKDGEKPPLELFLKKRLPASGVELMDNAMKQVMLREGRFLKEFTQKLNQLSLEKTDGSKNLTGELFPKTYYYDDEIIVMENLVKRGYFILPKKARQDFKDASTVVRHMAKLHATSFVMIENAGGCQIFLDSNPDFEDHMLKMEFTEMMSKAFEPGFRMALEVLKNSTHKEKDDKYKLLKKYEGKLVENMCESITAETLFSSVLHGDCWNNNIMFDNTREKVIFVDFQGPRVGSPNLDLSYFMFTSTKPEVRKQWKELLKIYFDSLKKNIELLGQSFEFKFEDFVADFIRKSKLGFFFGFFCVIVMEAMTSHDTKSADILTAMSTMVTKWVEENPDKAQIASESMISMINDYLLFGEL